MTTSTNDKTTPKENTGSLTIAATGSISAAFVSSGIGIFAIGFLTTFAVISEGLKNFLNWWNPAGPLTGKTGLGIILWLVSWAILGNVWKEKGFHIDKAFRIMLVLIVLGLIMTFPPVFEAFE